MSKVTHSFEILTRYHVLCTRYDVVPWGTIRHHGAPIGYHEVPWVMAYGIWNMECGVRNMEYGVWSMDHGLWSMEYGAGVWSMSPGIMYYVPCTLGTIVELRVELRVEPPSPPPPTRFPPKPSAATCHFPTRL